MSSPSSSTARALARDLEHTSRELAIRARRGERAAINELVRRCVPWLRRWASGRLPRWARSIADTSDLVQDAVTRALPLVRRLNLRGRRALAAYLQTAVQNRIRDEHRILARRGTPHALDEGMAGGDRSPLDEIIVREEVARYRAALTSLSPDDRDLVVGHLELEYSHEQLGIMTHRSANAARMALQRAVRRLVERMRDA